MVDVKLRKVNHKQIDMEFHSHGRLHKLNLIEAGRQLADVSYYFLGMSESEAANAKEKLKVSFFSSHVY